MKITFLTILIFLGLFFLAIRPLPARVSSQAIEDFSIRFFDVNLNLMSRYDDLNDHAKSKLTGGDFVKSIAEFNFFWFLNFYLNKDINFSDSIYDAREIWVQEIKEIKINGKSGRYLWTIMNEPYKEAIHDDRIDFKIRSPYVLNKGNYNEFQEAFVGFFKGIHVKRDDLIRSFEGYRVNDVEISTLLHPLLLKKHIDLVFFIDYQVGNDEEILMDYIDFSIWAFFTLFKSDDASFSGVAVRMKNYLNQIQKSKVDLSAKVDKVLDVNLRGSKYGELNALFSKISEDQRNNLKEEFFRYFDLDLR